MIPALESRLLQHAVLTQAATPSSRGAVILHILMTLLALPYLWSSAFSGFSSFDDEGALLISIGAFVKGQRMYDDVYSLYGALYNLFYGLLYGMLNVALAHRNFCPLAFADRVAAQFVKLGLVDDPRSAVDGNDHLGALTPFGAPSTPSP